MYTWQKSATQKGLSWSVSANPFCLFTQKIVFVQVLFGSVFPPLLSLARGPNLSKLPLFASCRGRKVILRPPLELAFVRRIFAMMNLRIITKLGMIQRVIIPMGQWKYSPPSQKLCFVTRLCISFHFEWSDEDASEASIRVAFPSEARKSGA